MALLNLSLVTRTLVKLVHEAAAASGAAPSPLNVTSLPPDKLTEDNSLGIYLYHLVEEAALKNQPWRSRPDRPIRHSPIGLNLHYVVTARSLATDNGDAEGPYREQLLMGLAVKALHDYPIIDELTEIGGAKILDAGLVGDENRLRLSLRHVPANEAVSFWTAGSQALRLSAYYEVSVVIVEPEEPAAAGGRVLTTGLETFIGGLPRLSASRSIVTFTIPGEATARNIEVQPAQPAIGDELVLVGSGLGGAAVELMVRASGGAAAVAAGPTWGVSALGDRVYARVQDLLDSAPTMPGAYAASVAITRTRTLADGSSRSTTVLSNETPFQIVPAVATVGTPSAGVFTITGGLYADPTRPLAHPSQPSVRASIANVELSAGTAGSLAPGEFARTSATAIEMALPAGAVSGQFLPVRVIVNGGESPPAWVVVP